MLPVRVEYQTRLLVGEAESLLGPDALIDMGVRIHVVRQDIENGTEVIAGMAPVVSLDTHELGGIFDTTRQEFVGPSTNPKIWYCTPDALPVILHGDELEDCQLAVGGFGAGKTLGILRYWIMAQVIRLAEYAPIEMGVTAPTDSRLEEIINGVMGCCRPDWYTYLVKPRLFSFRCGVKVRCIGTAKRSASQGSRLQGWNFAACASDELEDQVEEDSNINARGRRAPHGHYKRCATATLKADPAFRNLHADIKTNPHWGVHRFIGPSNPFAWPAYWEFLRDTMSKPLFDRVVMALDVASERATYPAWSREHNVRPVPLIGAEDVTEKVLGRYGPNYTIGVGHDPGIRYDVSEFFKCYHIKGEKDPVYWIVDELTTERTSTEEHVAALVARLRTKWDCHKLDFKGRPLDDSPKAHIRIDPQGNSDNKTDKSVYEHFAHAKLDARSAAFRSGTPKGRVPKDAGIEMVNRLMCNAKGLRRLFVDCDSRGKPAAPRFVEAVELSERDLLERAEMDRKGDSDLSHWCAAVRYFLHPLEHLPESLVRLV